MDKTPKVRSKTPPLSTYKSPEKVQARTIIEPQRMAFPGIYSHPSEIAAEAASRVAPESPNLKRLFGVNRDDLYEIGKDLRGNLPGTLPGAAVNPRGSVAAESIMNPKNVQRILDVNAEAEKFPALVRGMDPWYVMTPYYQRMVELLGPERAAFEYRLQNTLMGMASPGSEVTTEIPRGSAAYFLHKQGRFPEFMQFMGVPAAQREAAGVPKDIIDVPGHMYHKTAQALPMDKFLRTGEFTMTTPKVPMYIEASGVPQIGFQTQTPVGDAHWSRAVGLADTRGAKTSKGKEVVPGGSVSNPEMTQLAPWWRDKIAAQLGIESVPAQARTWGAFSGQTGVTTPIGSPKLEMIADKIVETAQRLGVSPETARDMVMTGEARMGKKDGGLVDSAPEEAIKNTITDPQAFKMLDMDLANLALMSQQPPRRMADGGKMSKDEDLFALKPQPKPAVPTVRELVAEIGKSPARYEAKYPAKDFTPLELQAYRLMQAAKATPDANRYLESLNPYFDSQLKFDIGAGSDAGYVEPKVPNLAVVQQLQDIKNTIPHELTHTLQLGKGKGTELERDRQVMQRAKALPIETQKTMMPSGNRYENMKETWANINARAHEVNAAGGDFINSPEGRALFPTPEMQREYYTRSMPGVNSLTPSTGTFVANTSAPVDRSKQSYAQQALRALGFAQGGVVHMAGGGRPPLRSLDEVPSDEYLKAEIARINAAPTVRANSADETANYARYVAERASQPIEMPARPDYTPGFSVLEKPTYGSEVPGTTPTVDQQRYELTMKGQQEAANKRYRAQQGDALAGMDPTGTLAVTDAARTMGLGMLALPVHAGRTAFHYLQHGNMKDAPTGMDYEEFMSPRTPEGAELVEEIGTAGSRLTGSEMAFGMNPTLWAYAPPTVAQMRAGLKLGAERAAPVLGKVDKFVREGYDSGLIPQPGFSTKDVTPKALAPATEQGFYSPTEAAGLNLKRQSGNGQAFLNDIMKGENVSSEEISGMGLDTFLKGRTSVTAAEVQDYIAQNKLKLGEASYGTAPKLTPEEKARLTYLDEENRKSPLGAIDDRLGEGTYEELIRLENIRDRSSVSSLYDRQKETERRAQQMQRQGMQTAARALFTQANHFNARAEALDLEGAGIPKPTKFQGYSLPGGKNYREVVITMPTEGRGLSEIELDKINRRLVDQGYDGLGEEQRAVAMRGGNEAMDMLQDLEDRVGIRTDDLMKAMAGGDPRTQYRSSHFDEPNILAHLRMSDRVTDGKKTLLVDEVQSDWHQAGREKGYGPTMEKLVEAYYETKDGQRIPIGFGKTKEEAEANIDVGWKNMVDIKYETHERKVKEGVPDAPYKEDWYQLALRRAVKEAIDGGYDRVALVTGGRVNERFKLSKYIDTLRHQKTDDGKYLVEATKDGSPVFNDEIPKEKLASIVGKEMAQKIIDEEGQSAPKNSINKNMKTLAGLDLEVGGEGNKKYYDEIYPNYLKKFGKKYGASVGTTGVEVPPDSKADYQRLRKYQGALDYKNGQITWPEFLARHPEAAKDFTEPLHYMDITPAMRKEFSTGIHMKRGGKVSFADSLDAMRYELNKRQ